MIYTTVKRATLPPGGRKGPLDRKHLNRFRALPWPILARCDKNVYIPIFIYFTIAYFEEVF